MTIIKHFKYDYVPKEGEENLKTYTYHGGDQSILYNYVHGPLAQWLVNNVVPSWVAPNLITMLGFQFTLIPHILISYNAGWDLKGEIPSWVCILTGICTLIYLLLDNMDGKQARKTKSSSPLGLLFDHGCDAITSVLAYLNMCMIMHWGANPLLCLFGFFFTILPFYTSTWEEYYIKGLYLPMIHAASEGIVFLACMYIYTGLVPQSNWYEPSFIPGLTRGAANFWLLMAITIITAIFNLFNVKKHQKDQFIYTLKHFIPIGMMIVTTLAVYVISEELLEKYSKFHMYFLGINFAKLVSTLQLAHVADLDFMGVRKTSTIYYSLLVTGLLLRKHVPILNWFSELHILLIMLAVSIISYFHMVFNVIHQIKKVLRIRTFRIPHDGKKSN